jgi:hypothetical protein
MNETPHPHPTQLAIRHFAARLHRRPPNPKSTPTSTRAGAAACVWYARQLPDRSISPWHKPATHGRFPGTLHEFRLHCTPCMVRRIHVSIHRSRRVKPHILLQVLVLARTGTVAFREHTVYRRYSSCCVEAQALLWFQLQSRLYIYIYTHTAALFYTLGVEYYSTP